MTLLFRLLLIAVCATDTPSYGADTPATPPCHWFNGYTQSLPNLHAASAFQAFLDNDATLGRASAVALANCYRLQNSNFSKP